MAAITGPAIHNHLLKRSYAIIASAFACNLYGADDALGSRIASGASEVDNFHGRAEAKLESGQVTSRSRAFADCSRNRTYRWDLLPEAGHCASDLECALYVAAIQTGDIDQQDSIETNVEVEGTATQQADDGIQIIVANATPGWCLDKPETDLVPGQTCGYTLNLSIEYPAHSSTTVISSTVRFDQIASDDHEFVSNILDLDGGVQDYSFEPGGRYEMLGREYVETLTCAQSEWDATSGEYGTELGSAGTTYYLVFEELRQTSSRPPSASASEM